MDTKPDLSEKWEKEGNHLEAYISREVSVSSPYLPTAHLLHLRKAPACKETLWAIVYLM